MQLQSIGWEELQIVPWLRWVIESGGHGFGVGQSLTTTPAVAAQVLPVISKAWDSLSASSKDTVQSLLVNRTIIPTKLGMRRPTQAYFASVKLFDDLPTITSLQGVKEKFLSALGVRKTIELNVVFDRLMAKSADASVSEESKWSHVDLIKYLVSVKEDIPTDDVKRLRNTPICTAEGKSADDASKGKLYRVSELYEPTESVRKLGLPALYWPGPYRGSSPEGRFLRMLGLNPFPSVQDLIDILSKAPNGGELQKTALDYWIINNFQNGYNKVNIAGVETAFLPVQPLKDEKDTPLAKPAQCYADSKASVLKFRVLREDLQEYHATFGVAMDPPIDACAERLAKSPPQNPASARSLFGYLAGRLNEITPNGNLANRLGEARIVPILDRSVNEKRSVRIVTPRSCFIGDGSTYGDIFDFVDFDAEANTFLLRVGSKHEPSAAEIAGMLVRQPARLLQTLGHEKYLQILRKIAEHASALKKDKNLWQQLKSTPCLLAEKQVSKVMPGDDEKVREVEDEELTIKEYSLAAAPAMVLMDDFATYRLFQSSLLIAPQDETLEGLYASLETPWLSRLVEDDQRMGNLLRDQSSAQSLQKLIVERCRLFLYDHTSDVVRHDAKWLEQNLTVKGTEFLQVTRRLKGYRLQFVEKRTAALHRESKRDATLYVTAQYDLYEVSRALMSVLLKRPRQQDYLALEMLMESNLRRLKAKGYNVDRILRQKAAESRIADSERKKREDEQQRLAEEEAKAKAALVQAQPQPALTNGTLLHEEASTLESPERQLSMPGAFNDSPPSSSRNNKKPASLFNSLTKHLGMNTANPAIQNQMQNLLPSSNGQLDAPPPYEPREPSRVHTGGSEQVTSPRDLHHNLESAIKASRAYNSSSLFTPPQTNNIKETPSYCDNRPGHDLSSVADLPHGIKLFLHRQHPNPTAFLQTNSAAIANFTFILSEVAGIFSLPSSTLNIFHDDSGSAIAFNSNGSIFCNLRYFMQLHLAAMGTPEGKVEAMAYWFITMCHELAHNLVGDHNSQHEFYSESFASGYFRRMLWWAQKMGSG